MNGGYYLGRSTFRLFEALFHFFMKRGQRQGRQDELGKMLVEGWQKARSAYASAFVRHMAAEMEVRHHPEHLRALAREAANADPQYHFYGTATVMIDGAGLIDNVPAETRVRLSTLAMSVLSNDAEYARWHGHLSPEDQAICDALRADWQGKAVLAQEAQRKLDAGMADWRANRDRWFKDRFVPHSQGLPAWLMTQSPQVWHVWADSLVDGPDLTRDLASAIRTVADHPDCNHATALRLLVSAVGAWDDTIEPLAKHISARLERQDFTGPGFALDDHEWNFAKALLDPVHYGLTLSAAALGQRGSVEVVVEQRFKDGYLYRPYPEWRGLQGQPGA